MDIRWLLWMRRWAQNPPSARLLAVIVLIVGAGLALVAIEHVWGWPAALTPNTMGRGVLPR